MLRARETKVTEMQKCYGRLWEATTVNPAHVFYPHPQKSNINWKMDEEKSYICRHDKDIIEKSESVTLVKGVTQLVHNVKATSEGLLLVITFDVRMTPVQIQKENQNYSSFIIIHSSLPKSNSCRQCNFCMNWESLGLRFFLNLFCTIRLFQIGCNNNLAGSKAK